MSEYVGLKKGKVHDKHIISEYYCGGCGWPVTDHDSYCPECGGALHEGKDKSRWHELFGTPERAAETAWRLLMCRITTRCETCPMGDGCDISTDVDCDDGEAALLEWLSGDA